MLDKKMALSDDPIDVLPQQLVSNYHFVDENDELVSFSVLPVRWISDDQGMGGDKTLDVFLLGTAGADSVRRMHKHVVSWRFDLSYTEPEISVLSTDSIWIKLCKPKKRFEDIVRPILVTLQCLHFLMRNPETSEKSLGRHVAKVMGLHEARPFKSDLSDHMSLIKEAIGRIENLAKSKFLQEFLNQSPRKRELTYKKDFKAKHISTSIIDETSDGSKEDKDDKSTEGPDPNDTVCALCDEGGELLCCEGRCLRAFHATKNTADAATSRCKSLGFTEDEVDAMENFVCENCKYEQHQCFVCGKLGISSESKGQEVFRCSSTMCGRFYHPHCVARLIHSDNNRVSVKEIEKDISQRRPFTCPIHQCNFCKEDEDEDDPDLQFAVCRRCPKSYHIKCLPRIISFDDNKNTGVVRRAWRDLLPNRVLMYCLQHEINPKSGTAYRNHIKFPDFEQKLPSISRKRKSMKRNKRYRKRHKNSESETKTKPKSPSDEFKTSKSGSGSDHSPIWNETNNGVLRFVDGPWDAYLHHPNGGWIDD